MKVSVLTLGCRVNQSESDIIEGNLKRLGWSKVGLTESPDYCVINTCSVTAKSDYQSRQLIRRAVRSGAKVIVTGCYSQLNEDVVRNMQGVFKVVSNANKSDIIKMITDKDESCTFIPVNRSRPYLKIQDGCNRMCSYCAVPLARGRSRSVPASEVVRLATEINAAGYHEIVITGIHLGSYGYDLKYQVKLSHILKLILKKTRIKRIRLSSIEMTDIDSELLELIEDERVCRHLHLPLQSGNDRILKLMHRKYSSRDYITIVDKLLKRASGLALGTDVIVGFPGEGDSEFKNTRRLLHDLPITYIHAFPFSPRANTLAANMAAQNASVVKRERVSELKALSDSKRMAYMISRMNKIVDIIIEQHGIDDTSIGTSSDYLKVRIPSNGYPKGTLVGVRITGVENNCVRGELIKNLKQLDFK
jgi:threonylcarbamoyladenosine tRNA methylthiotransferase MtaB